MEISRHDLIGAIKDKVHSTLPKCFEALEKAKLDMNRVDKVALVGGSTMIPYVQQIVAKELLEGNTSKLVSPLPRDPTTSVAMGAAIKAATYGTTHIADDRRFQIMLKSYNSTQEVRHTVYGSVHSLDDELDLSEGTVEIEDISVASYNEETNLGKNGHFRFRGVPLTQNALNNFDLIVRGERAVEIGRIPIVIQHSLDIQPLPTDIGGGEPLAKAWRLEVVGRKGRLEKFDLLEEGTPVPATRTYDFITTDQTGKVRIALFEEDRLIREILVEVPTSLPVDSAVNLNIRCDEKYFITVDGNIPDAPGIEFHVEIEPPPPPPIPTTEDVEELRLEFEGAVEYIKNPDRQGRLWTEFQKTYDDIQEAFSNQDEPKLRQRVPELAALVAQALEPELEDRLEPPKEKFDELVRELNTMLLMSSLMADKIPNITELREAIETHRQLGEESYAKKDQIGYKEAFKGLAAIYQAIAQAIEDEIGGPGPGPGPDPVIQARGIVVNLQRKHQQLARNPNFRLKPDWRGASEWLEDVNDELVAIGEEIRTLEPLIFQEPERVTRQGLALQHRLENLEMRVLEGPPSPPEVPEGTVGKRKGEK